MQFIKFNHAHVECILKQKSGMHLFTRRIPEKRKEFTPSAVSISRDQVVSELVAVRLRGGSRTTGAA